MEEALLALLTGSAGVTALVPAGRIVWASRVGPTLPAIVLWTVSARPDYAMAGANGLVVALVQIDCWGSTYAQAKSTARAVKAALSGHRDGVFQGLFVEGERDSFEAGDGAPPDAAPTGFHRTSLDVRAWHFAN